MPFLFGEDTIAHYVTHRECELTKRSDIIDNSDRYITRNTPTGLIYTENLGWIDLGHANPTGAERLWQQMVMPRGGLLVNMCCLFYFLIRLKKHANLNRTWEDYPFS